MSAGLSIPYLPVSTNILHFDDEFLLQKQIAFLSFSDIQGDFSPLRPIFYWRKVKTAFYVSRWTFWRNSFLQGKKIYLHFPITGGKNLALCRNFSSVFVRTASLVFIKTFWGKLFLLEKLGFLILLRSWAKNFGPSFKKFSAGYQNCILYFHRNNVMERIRFFFFLNFRHWEKIFLPFLGKIWRESQNCFLKVHTNFFEENILSWKNRFLDFFQTWVETFLIFVVFFQPSFQNCFLWVHTNFWGKMFFLNWYSSY